MNKLIIVLSIITISSCSSMKSLNSDEIFELLYYGISVSEGKELLKNNNIEIIDEEIGKYDNGKDLCIIKTKGNYFKIDCDIEYHFMDDKLFQGFYQFNTYDYNYTEDELENIKLFFIDYFSKKYNMEPEILIDDVWYIWILENKIQIVISKISDNWLEINYIGIHYLINMETPMQDN